MLRVQLAGLLAIVSVTVCSVIPGEAGGIVCRDGSQLVAGSYISTPYCKDELLAQVARGYGMKAPADKIRYNPNFKREVCRFVGHDIRVQDNCLNESPSIRLHSR